MVLTKTAFYAVAGLLALSAHGAPLQKRIAQVIADSTTQWVAACTAAGGAAQCGTTSQTAFMTLLAAAGDCDQQNAADAMIDLAKTLKSDATMIALAQVFAQQPRNSPDKLSVNYCQQPPKNAELQGLFQCQFQGVDPQTFTKNVKVGGAGTIPLGLNAPLSPPGSCKANPQGGIADGSQLVDLTQDPGVGGGGSASSSNSTGTSNVGGSASGGSGTTNGTSSDSGSTDGGASSGSGSTDGGASSGSGSSAGDSGSADDDSGSSDSGSGSSSCDNGGSAASGNSSDGSGSGSDTGSTASGADAGASNGSSTSGAGSGAASDGAAASATGSGAAASSTASAGGGFQLQNGKDAQALNAKFAALTATSPCTAGEQACVAGGFAQCVSGAFVATQCAAGTQCFALPLVNSAGTSIACTTQADATARFAATGVTGGPSGA